MGLSQLTSLCRASRIRDLSSFRLWLMRARRRFSMMGLVARRCSDGVLFAGFFGISMLRQAIEEEDMVWSVGIRKCDAWSDVWEKLAKFFCARQVSGGSTMCPGRGLGAECGNVWP